MTSLHRWTLHAALGVIVSATAGCGPSLSVRVERVGTARKSDLPPPKALSDARKSVVEAAEAIDAFVDQIERCSSDHPKLEDARQFARAAPAKAAGGDLAELQKLAAEASRRRGELNDLIVWLQEPEGGAKALNLPPDQREELRKAQAKAANRVWAAERAVVRLQYGGYQSESIYILAPGSEAFKRYAAGGTTSYPAEKALVYNEVTALATGDSVLLAVQDSPAHFSMRYVKSDPTEVIRNTIIIITRVLRVAAAYVPLISGVNEAIGNVAPASQTAAGAVAENGTSSESTTVAEATAAMASSDESVRKVLNDPQLQDILARLRADPNAEISEKDRAILSEKLAVLKAVVGNPTTP